MKVWISRILSSKTMVVALLISIGGVVQANTEFLKSVLTPDTYGWVMFVVGIIMAALRVVTTQPLDEK